MDQQPPDFTGGPSSDGETPEPNPFAQQPSPDGPLAQEPAPGADSLGQVPAPESVPTTVTLAPRGGGKRFLIAGAIAGGGLVVIGGVLGTLLALRSQTPAIDRMIPASATVYATVSFNPSLGQKVNLLAVAHRFPDLTDDADLQKHIDEGLDKVLKDSGISFSGDVRPWLGSRMSLVMQVKDVNSSPATAVLLETKDDKKAQATADLLTTSEDGRKHNWSTRKYAGVTIQVGSPKAGMSKDDIDVIAIVDHVVIVGNSESLAHDLIDADHGKAGLLSSSAYQRTVKLLPTDRLGLLYVDGPSTISLLKSSIKSGKARLTKLPDSTLKQLDAFQGLGFAVVARPNGIAGDLEVRLDPSKLDASSRASLAAATHRNAVLDWIPADAYGFYALTNLKQGLEAAINQPEALDAQSRQMLETFGLSGGNGVITHLTGDAGFELEPNPAGGPIPAGAFMIGTNDAGSMQFLFSRVTDFVGSMVGTSSADAVTIRKLTYHGVELTVLHSDEFAEYGNIEPAYAVTQGMGILASSPAELEALIDVHSTGQSVRTAATYKAASQVVTGQPVSVFYLDVAATVKAIESAVPQGSGSHITLKGTGDLEAVHAVIVAAESRADRVRETFFILVP